MSKLDRRQFLFGSFPFFWRHPSVVRLDEIRFDVIRHGRSPHRYLLIHGDEETAREVLIAHMRRVKGTAYVVTSHDRYVPVESGKIDPNRMFSREGAEKNLRSLNSGWDAARLETALHKLDRGRGRLVSHFLPPRGGRLVAVHNNSRGYSVRDEAADSDRVSLKDAGHPHEFFLCTDPADYAILAESPYNVVLQHVAPKVDDGSLSRLSARRGVRYINLEVSLGARQRQVEMLDWLEAHLR